MLQEKWMCNAPGCKNKGLHCYINPVDGSHFTLSHDHLNIWALAIVSVSVIFNLYFYSWYAVSNKVLIVWCKQGHLFLTSSMLWMLTWWWGGITDIAATALCSHPKGLGGSSYHGYVIKHGRYSIWTPETRGSMSIRTWSAYIWLILMKQSTSTKILSPRWMRALSMISMLKGPG